MPKQIWTECPACQYSELLGRSLLACPECGGQWLDARYHLARCAFELKDYEECRKLLGVTKLLYPNLGNDEVRARFASLEAKLRDKSQK